VDTKWHAAPATFTRYYIDYRYGLFNQDVAAAIHKLYDLPPAHPLNPEETRALVVQLDYPTLAPFAKRYHNLNYSQDDIRERLGVSRDNKKLENFMKAQVFE